LTGKTKLVAGVVQEALDGGAAPMDILEAMTMAMDVVGDKFSKGEIFVPEMLIAAKAMSKGVDVLKPLLAVSGAPSLGACVIGTVQGDLHDIGKTWWP
jgi:methanogenic corrinoid protein MtbC1